MSAAVYIPCPAGCGCLVLTGRTDDGREVVLDPHIPCYVMLWAEASQPLPRLSPSRGYPVHVCPQKGG